MIVYLSGPMTGLPQFNHDAFKLEQQKEEIGGNIVLSPHHLPLGLAYSAYMDIAMAQIRACDQVRMLPGWSNSKGATAEYAYALSIGKDITGADR